MIDAFVLWGLCLINLGVNYGTHNVSFANAGTNANTPVLIEGVQSSPTDLVAFKCGKGHEFNTKCIRQCHFLSQ